MVLKRRNGSRQLRDHDEDDDDACLVLELQFSLQNLSN